MNMKVIYTTYSEEYDITTIFEDIIENNKTISTEVKGFYYGEESEELTKKYYGKLKAEYN